ncbi:MAG: hypothetical protein ACTSX7_18930 [Alphaproteobacteria bacterium]
MDLYDILSPFTMLLGVFFFVREMVLEFTVGWQSAPPLDTHQADDRPDSKDQSCPNNHPCDEDEATSVMAYQGEPWFASVNLWAWGLQSGAIVAGSLACFLRGDEFLNLASEWINVHPFWSGAIGLTCSLIALVLGAMRQTFIKLMSLVLALPMEDEDGRPFLGYLGGIPPFAWQYSPWFRSGSWMAVTAMSLICAYIGAELFSQALDGGFVLLFGLLLYIRWAISSLPSRFWVG